jgi:hypothetical protein
VPLKAITKSHDFDDDKLRHVLIWGKIDDIWLHVRSAYVTTAEYALQGKYALEAKYALKVEYALKAGYARKNECALVVELSSVT